MITKQDKKNAFWNSSSFIFLSVAGFINFSLTLKTYSSEVFGLYILMISIFGLGYTFDFGFGAAIIRQLSIARKENDINLIKKFFLTFFVVYIVLSLTITAITSAYYFMFLSNSELVIQVKDVNTNLIFILISSSFFFQYLNNYLKIVFEGFSDFIVLSKLLFTVTAFNTILIVLLYVLKLDIIYLALITFIVQLFSVLIFFIKLIDSHRELSLSFNNYDYTLIKKYMMYGINIQVSSFITSLIDPVVKLLIGSYLSLSFVTFFETSKKIINLSNGLIFSAQKGIFNKLSEQHSLGTLDNFLNDDLYYYSKMSNYYSVLVYGLLNPLICIGMMLWFKSFESVIILLLYFLPYSLINYGGALYSVLMVDGKGLRLVIIQSINLVTTSLLLFLSLYISNSYLGLSAFYLSIIINTFVIFIMLKKANNFKYNIYIKSTGLFDILIMNFITIIQLVLMYIFSEYYVTILIIFLFIYFVVFYKYVKYFHNILMTKFIKDKIKFNY
ncbi:MAG: oligosaccharide flippase family protein [Candidatus Kapaibacterium sp.]